MCRQPLFLSTPPCRPYGPSSRPPQAVTARAQIAKEAMEVEACTAKEVLVEAAKRDGQVADIVATAELEHETIKARRNFSRGAGARRVFGGFSAHRGECMLWWVYQSPCGLSSSAEV